MLIQKSFLNKCVYLKQHKRNFKKCPLPRKKSLASVEKPEWVKDLEQDAAYDPEVTKVLEGTNGDPEKIRKNMRIEQELKRKQIYQERTGVAELPQIIFRKIDYFNLWVWFEYYKVPTSSEREMLREVLNSWFLVGKLGGYNAANMQLSTKSMEKVCNYNYDREACADSLDSFLHEMEELENNKNWSRIRLDIGTADELCLDVLINLLVNFSKEYVGLKSIYFGGNNPDWPLPKNQEKNIDDYDDWKSEFVKKAQEKDSKNTVKIDDQLFHIENQNGTKDENFDKDEFLNALFDEEGDWGNEDLLMKNDDSID